jgi:hypothetical protein
MASIVLGGTTYEVPQLFALDSCELLPRLLPLVAEVGALFVAGIAVVLGEAAGTAGLEPASITAVSLARLLEQEIDPMRVAMHLNDLLPGIERLCAKLPRGELRRLIPEVLKGTTANGVPLFGAQVGPTSVDTFDTVMRGRSGDVFRLLLFAVKDVHYPDVVAGMFPQLFQDVAASGGSATRTASPSGKLPT